MSIWALVLLVWAKRSGTTPNSRRSICRSISMELGPVSSQLVMRHSPRSMAAASPGGYFSAMERSATR